MRKTAVQREPIVNEKHMTPEHRKYLNYTTEDFTVWVRSIEESTEKTVTYFLTAGKELEQGYKSCASLTKLGERYGKKKLETACAEVLKYTSALKDGWLIYVSPSNWGVPTTPSKTKSNAAR